MNAKKAKNLRRLAELLSDKRTPQVDHTFQRHHRDTVTLKKSVRKKYKEFKKLEKLEKKD